MKAQYRIVHFVPDPFSGYRVPIAALVREGERLAVARSLHLPGPDCVGGRVARSTIELILAALNEATTFDQLPPFAGPHALLSDAADVPVAVEDAVEWVRHCVLPRAPEATAGDALPPRTKEPRRERAGARFFKTWKVSGFVKKRFEPATIGAKSAVEPITHYVAGRSDLLLMEPVLGRRSRFAEDLTRISTHFLAWKQLLHQMDYQKRATFIAYVFADGTKAVLQAKERLKSSADEIVDTDQVGEREAFLRRIKEIGTDQSPLFP